MIFYEENMQTIPQQHSVWDTYLSKLLNYSITTNQGKNTKLKKLWSTSRYISTGCSIYIAIAPMVCVTQVPHIQTEMKFLRRNLWRCRKHWVQVRVSDNWRTGLHSVIYLELNKSWSSIWRFLMKIVPNGDKIVVSVRTPASVQQPAVHNSAKSPHPAPCCHSTSHLAAPYWVLPAHRLLTALLRPTIVRFFIFYNYNGKIKGWTFCIKDIFDQPSSRLLYLYELMIYGDLIVTLSVHFKEF